MPAPLKRAEPPPRPQADWCAPVEILRLLTCTQRTSLTIRYVDEFIPWLQKDLAKANANRDKVPWIVGFAHKGWYMQPEVNFSMIDDVLHKGGADLFFAGHIHVYQRFLPLRTSSHVKLVQGVFVVLGWIVCSKKTRM